MHWLRWRHHSSVVCGSVQFAKVDCNANDGVAARASNTVTTETNGGTPASRCLPGFNECRQAHECFFGVFRFDVEDHGCCRVARYHKVFIRASYAGHTLKRTRLLTPALMRVSHCSPLAMMKKCFVGCESLRLTMIYIRLLAAFARRRPRTWSIIP